MGNSVVSKGKNVKEAVRTALEILEASSADVDIEIIEPESRGFLGLGGKPAVVRLTVKREKEAAPASPEPIDLLESMIERMELPEAAAFDEAAASRLEPVETAPEDLQGKVWVKDGRIHCRNAPDKYPIVIPNEGVKFYKNGERVEKTVVIAEGDRLSAEVRDEIREPGWDIKLNDDQLEAILEVTPGCRIRRKLKDRAPNNYVELDVEERKEPYPVDPEQAMRQAKEMGIVVGLDAEAVTLACGSEEAGSYVIARGVRPTPGMNGFLEPAKETDVKRGPKTRADGSVDFREVQQFPAVERGQVVAYVHPPEPGKAGISVRGKPVWPPEVHPIVVVEGKGVALVDKTVVVATEAGQPLIKLNGRYANVSIVPKLTVPHDVNLKSGNIRFAGAVEVLGTVQDGMTVEALGTVTVEGNANMANIVSGGSVLIRKNAITSDISAGKSSLLMQELNERLGELYEQLERVVRAMQQIMSISAYKASSVSRTGIGPLIKILCDGKFKGLPPLAVSFCNAVKADEKQLDGEWTALAERIYRHLVTPHLSELASIGEVQALAAAAGKLYRSTAVDEADPQCVLKACYLQNSKAYSAGNIHVAGEGAYNSKLYAKGIVHVDGYVRGGELYAGMGATVREAGAKGGIPTKLQAPEGQTIRIDRAMEGVTIQIGTKTHTFSRETERIVARLEKDGSLVF